MENHPQASVKQDYMSFGFFLCSTVEPQSVSCHQYVTLTLVF